MTNTINREVSINSFYFSDKRGQKLFPKIMELDGQLITFVSEGMQFLINGSEGLVRLFDMNDGQTTYRLRQKDNHWTLVGTF